MKNLLKSFFVACFAAILASGAWAADHGTAEEAVALVKKGIAFYKANGAVKTFADINQMAKGQFINKDLYLFVGNVKAGPNVAHGANARLVGKELGELKDVDGVYFVKKFSEIASSKEGKGWVDYKWPNPVTKQVEAKSTYVERVDEFYFASGIYKN